MADRTKLEAGISSSPRTKLMAATRNPDKALRLGRLIGRRHALLSLPAGVEPIEPEPQPRLPDSEPLITIAQVKAISVSSALGGVRTIASDGGLLVPGLGDRWQPAWTRRFAGPDASNHDRAVALLILAAGLAGDHRRLGWREVVAIAEAGRVIATFTAEATPGWLGQTLPADWVDDGQGFWVPRLWLSNPMDSTATTHAGSDHWDRLALVVVPFLDGLAARSPQ